MKRVMFFSKQSAFWCGIHKLLDDGNICDIVGWETEPDQALERIRELQPDVILIEKGGATSNAMLTIMGIVGNRSSTRVIALSLDSDTLSLYREDQRAIRDVEDLFRAIDQDPPASQREFDT